jgi:hypothetical protein
MFTPQQWLLLAALFVPMLTLIGIFWIGTWIRSLKQERAPVSEKLLRPAGESSRRELEKLDEKINEAMIWAFFGPLIVTAFLVASNATQSATVGPIGLTSLIVLTTGGFILVSWRLIRLVQLRRNYRLGYAGERAVAEELNQLMLEGCRVFHDVPMEPYGNIDHVILAPTGIYAVETKARRKRHAPRKRAHEVIFDGHTLIFPNGTDMRAVEQARHQADRLRRYLTKAIGEPVNVSAILTLPGWLVTRRAKGNLNVLNPKNIPSVVQSSRLPPLSNQLLDRVAYQLDQRCRDVEF